MHMIMRTLATGSQGFDPKRGILLRPHPITSACPPLQTPEPASVLAISDPLCDNSASSALHPLGLCPITLWTFQTFILVLLPLPLCSVNHWESTHNP